MTMNKIVVFGAGGRSGRAIIAEARYRGHQVTAAVRDPATYADLEREEVALIAGDAMDPNEVRKASAGHDVAVNATRSAGGIDPEYLIRLNDALLTGLADAGVRRLLIVGGAGTLEVAPGLQLVDTPAFPESAKPRGIAHREVLKALQKTSSDIDWVYVTPPPNFLPHGPRTGTYQVVRQDQLLTEEHGKREISYADYAIGILDEIESPKYHNESIALVHET